MKRINPNLIIVPLEFKIACTIYKLDMAQVLQILIDHVTLYDTICQKYNEGFSEASRMIVWYVRSKGKIRVNSRAMRKCKQLFWDNLRHIEILARKKKRGWKTATKRSYTRCFVETIFRSMERLHTPSDLVYLDEFSTLKLSKDFCVLCEIHNCYPKEYLEYFMGQISLADAHARKGLKMPPDNATFMFFQNIANGFGRDASGLLDLSDFEIDFYEKMDEIRLALYIVRDLEERTAILGNHYLSHYQSMNPQ
ncbi:hypothetical protein [Pedobacter sp. L105]|uniref:hypothetical protein n=1 Tax=Pedobacter sp. L105 TaxID=1641871 RepID=UPI00131BEEB9|nr:hypothetical protein [Pedobacter sp. L105]